MEKLSFMYVYYYFSNPTVKGKNRLTIIITVYSRIKRQTHKQLMMVRPAHKQLMMFRPTFNHSVKAVGVLHDVYNYISSLQTPTL